MTVLRYVVGMALRNFEASLFRAPAQQTWAPSKAWARKIICGALAVVLLTQALIFGLIWVIGSVWVGLTWQDALGIVTLILGFLALIAYGMYEYYGNEPLMPESKGAPRKLWQAFTRGWEGR